MLVVEKFKTLLADKLGVRYTLYSQAVFSGLKVKILLVVYAAIYKLKCKWLRKSILISVRLSNKMFPNV